MKRFFVHGGLPMLKWAVLGSGSSGNAYYMSDGETSILLDQGFSLAELDRRLIRFGSSVDELDALFVTHLHPDHARGAGILARRCDIPIHLHTKAITHNAREFAALGIPSSQVADVEAGEVIRLGTMNIFCFSTSHDSPGSVGWYIDHPDQQVMLLTDLGKTTEEQKELAQKASVLFLEANYDEKMLEYGPYPRFLKKRIRSVEGHLSNDQAFSFVQESGFSGNELYFVHLSDINNDPRLLEEQAEGLVSTPFIVCEKNRWYGTIGAAQ